MKSNPNNRAELTAMSRRKHRRPHEGDPKTAAFLKKISESARQTDATRRETLFGAVRPESNA